MSWVYRKRNTGTGRYFEVGYWVGIEWICIKELSPLSGDSDAARLLREAEEQAAAYVHYLNGGNRP